MPTGLSTDKIASLLENKDPFLQAFALNKLIEQGDLQPEILIFLKRRKGGRARSAQATRSFDPYNLCIQSFRARALLTPVVN